MAPRDYDDEADRTEAADTDLADTDLDDGAWATLEEQRYGGGAYVGELDGDLDDPEVDALVGQQFGLDGPDAGQDLDGADLGDDYAGDDYDRDPDISRDDALGMSM